MYTLFEAITPANSEELRISCEARMILLCRKLKSSQPYEVKISRADLHGLKVDTSSGWVIITGASDL